MTTAISKHAMMPLFLAIPAPLKHTNDIFPFPISASLPPFIPPAGQSESVERSDGWTGNATDSLLQIAGQCLPDDQLYHVVVKEEPCILSKNSLHLAYMLTECSGPEQTMWTNGEFLEGKFFAEGRFPG